MNPRDVTRFFPWAVVVNGDPRTVTAMCQRSSDGDYVLYEDFEALTLSLAHSENSRRDAEKALDELGTGDSLALKWLKIERDKRRTFEKGFVEWRKRCRAKEEELEKAESALSTALRERDKFQAQIELALDQRDDALRERDEWKSRAEKAEESLAAESLLHDLTRMACDKLRGELEECKQRKGKAVAYRAVTEAENTRLKAEMRGMVKISNLIKFSEKKYREVDQRKYGPYTALNHGASKVIQILDYLASRASRSPQEREGK